MMEFGNTLRLAREAKGYTQAQVAELTRMAPSTVADLEEENFSRIAAPIYGRGFVKLYCEAVGLEPKPLIDEFMSIYNGERHNGIKERRPAAAPVAAKEPPPAAETPFDAPRAPEANSPAPAPEFAKSEPAPAPAPSAPAPASPAPPVPEPPRQTVAAAPAVDDFADDPPLAAQQRVSRYAAPIRTMRAPSIPPAVWRIGILAVAAVLVAWVAAIGIRALYRATTTDRPVQDGLTTVAVERPAAPAAPKPAEKTAAPAAAKPSAEKPAAEKPAVEIKREPQKIPDLYID